MLFFKRMASIEAKIFDVWKSMAVNQPLSAADRTKFTVFEYPLGDKYTNVWRAIQDARMPVGMQEALERVRRGNFAFLGESSDVKYQSMVNCDLIQIGDDFSRKPYAIAVQQGSPLKNEFDSV